MPDQEHPDAVGLGGVDQASRDLAQLADAARRGLEVGAAHGLDGVHHHGGRAGLGEGLLDVLELGGGQDLDLSYAGHSSRARAQAPLERPTLRR